MPPIVGKPVHFRLVLLPVGVQIGEGGDVMPLMRIPEQATLCEKIGGTEYTVTAHFREDGRDLLGLLSRIFMRDTADYSFDSEGYDED